MRIIDISEWQGEIDWNTAAMQIDGAIARASGYGWDRADYQFIRNRDELRRIGKPRGWYYFAGLGDPVQQANRFADIVGPLQDGETVWLDWEADAMAQGEAWALVFLRQATRRFGVTCGIYMSASPARSGWEQTRAEGYPLWVAAYNTSNPFWPDNDSDYWPWSIWQYSSAGGVAGINGPVDMNEVKQWPSTINTKPKEVDMSVYWPVPYKVSDNLWSVPWIDGGLASFWVHVNVPSTGQAATATLKRPGKPDMTVTVAPGATGQFKINSDYMGPGEVVLSAPAFVGISYLYPRK